MRTQHSRFTAHPVWAAAWLVLLLAACGDKREGAARSPEQRAEPAISAVQWERVSPRLTRSTSQLDLRAVGHDLGVGKDREHARGTTIRARWIYTAGKRTASSRRHAHDSQAGTGYTSFFVTNPEPWPVGDYELRVTLDGAADSSAEEVRSFKVEGEAQRSHFEPDTLATRP